jgi:hypothetical protein
MLYSFSFEQNPDWTREYPGQEEILVRILSFYSFYSCSRPESDRILIGLSTQRSAQIQALQVHPIQHLRRSRNMGRHNIEMEDRRERHRREGRRIQSKLYDRLGLLGLSRWTAQSTPLSRDRRARELQGKDDAQCEMGLEP